VTRRRVGHELRLPHPATMGTTLRQCAVDMIGWRLNTRLKLTPPVGCGKLAFVHVQVWRRSLAAPANLMLLRTSKMQGFS
jgi:hypothetical protein